MEHLALRGRQSYGFTLILTSLMLAFIVAVLGVLVDAAMLMAARDRLSEVVEGSAAAAGQALGGTATVEAAETRARAAALAVTKARFHGGILGLDPERIDLKVACRSMPQANGRPSGAVDVRVLTELTAPVYFMRLWGVAGVPVSDESHFTHRNQVTVLVLPEHSGGELQQQVAGLARSCSPYDTVRVIATGPGIAGLAAALEAGYREVQTIDQPAAANVIAIISAVPSPAAATDHAAAHVASQIRGDGRYRIQIGTVQWRPGAKLEGQLAHLRDFPSRLPVASAQVNWPDLP
ncbi:MAG: hypothetical protein IT162_06880 [Bryobacterales bacterium]|nr:hypothetical protein [Bryobacterales bacterium]